MVGCQKRRPRPGMGDEGHPRTRPGAGGSYGGPSCVWRSERKRVWLALSRLVLALTRVRVRVQRECLVRCGRWLCGWWLGLAICAWVDMAGWLLAWLACSRGLSVCHACGCLGRWPYCVWLMVLRTVLLAWFLEFRFCDLVHSSRVRARD